jgi:hypothetical protein
MRKLIKNGSIFLYSELLSKKICKNPSISVVVGFFNIIKKQIIKKNSEKEGIIQFKQRLSGGV